MKILSVMFILLGLINIVSAQESAGRYEKVMGELVKSINAQDHAAIRKDFAQVMLDGLPAEQCKEFFAGIVTAYGTIKTVGKPAMKPSGEAVFVTHFERGVLDVTISLDDNNQINGLLFLPHAADIPVHEKNQTPLALPFKGLWLVFWGGDTAAQNQHHDVTNQRYAFDFTGADESGKTRKGQSQANEDYFAFGREILAPADGEVTDVINGVRDNKPGSMNPYSALGNAVVIGHGQYEFSILAHLKLNSIAVKVGDKVKRGQVIGLCGNSGNSSEPHLHFHIQNTPVIQDGTGIKCYFQKVMVKGDKGLKSDYSPVKDQIISLP